MKTSDVADRERLTLEISRVVNRLRSFSPQRLAQQPHCTQVGFGPAGGRVAGPQLSLAELVRATAQELADLAARAAVRPARSLPVLPGFAVTDQLAVTAADVLAEGESSELAEATQALIQLRRQL